jgi:hypothetical protein
MSELNTSKKINLRHVSKRASTPYWVKAKRKKKRIY